MIVAFQGEPGAFSEDAIAKYFGPDAVKTLPQGAFADVVSAVADGRAEYGLLPVENSIAGAISHSERHLILARDTGAIERSEALALLSQLTKVRRMLYGLRGALARGSLSPKPNPAHPDT